MIEFFRPAKAEHVFSANGAAFTSSLGQRPRLREIKKTPPALKARFTSDTSSILLGWLRRAFSACCWSNQIPGARPQAEADKAPSALNKYNRRAFGARTKCARPCVGVRAPLFSATNSKRCEDTSQSKSTACEMQRNPNRRNRLPRFADHQDPKFFVLAMFNNWVGKRQNVTVT